MSMRVADGKLECRLTRPSALVLYGTENGNVTFDMNKDYYLFLAWGNVYESKTFHSCICGAVIDT